MEYREWRNDDDKEKRYAKKDFLRTVGGTAAFFVVFLIIALWYDGSGTIQNITEPNNALNYWPVTNIEIGILIALFFLLFGFRTLALIRGVLLK